MTSKIVGARAALGAVVVAAALSLAACGGSTGSTSATSTSNTTAAAPAPTATKATGQCGDDAVAAVKKVVTSSAVKQIHVIGGCSMLSIETSLAPGSLADGQKICEAASKVAYTGDISSVSVDGSDGHELSAGEKGQPCI